MPTYDYACGACGHRFERMHAMSQAPVRRCPKCGKRRVKRQVSSGGGFLFKGTGFYITDYRSKGYQEKAKADTEATKPKEDKSKPPEQPKPPEKSPEKPKEKPPEKPKKKDA
jgi:putative FmdB family regulatory protein